MDNFAKQPDKERKLIFEETAYKRDSTNIVIEKDFWVCWTLKRLYENPKISQYLTFKGGTSLSKAYGLIERFSEDIDLTIHRNAPFLKDVDDVMDADITNNERRRRIDTLKENAQKYIRDVVLIELKADIEGLLGNSSSDMVVLDQKDPEGQTILFYYPVVFDYKNHGTGYIAPNIKLEFGARGDTEPNETKRISPFVAETIPDIFDTDAFDVVVLSSERTFWEKATILHALHHGSKLRDRMSRHYYDTFMLSQDNTIFNKALNSPDLLEIVVKNKALLFRDGKASYDTAKIGSLKLLPKQDQIETLKKDYEKMTEMFMGQLYDFDSILKKLSYIEDKINK